jgi:hypothetical protein
MGLSTFARLSASRSWVAPFDGRGPKAQTLAHG